MAKYINPKHKELVLAAKALREKLAAIEIERLHIEQNWEINQVWVRRLSERYYIVTGIKHSTLFGYELRLYPSQSPTLHEICMPDFKNGDFRPATPVERDTLIATINNLSIKLIDILSNPKPTTGI